MHQHCRRSLHSTAAQYSPLMVIRPIVPSLFQSSAIGRARRGSAAPLLLVVGVASRGISDPFGVAVRGAGVAGPRALAKSEGFCGLPAGEAPPGAGLRLWAWRVWWG